MSKPRAISFEPELEKIVKLEQKINSRGCVDSHQITLAKYLKELRLLIDRSSTRETQEEIVRIGDDEPDIDVDLDNDMIGTHHATGGTAVSVQEPRPVSCSAEGSTKRTSSKISDEDTLFKEKDDSVQLCDSIISAKKPRSGQSSGKRSNKRTVKKHSSSKIAGEDPESKENDHFVPPTAPPPAKKLVSRKTSKLTDVSNTASGKRGKSTLMKATPSKVQIRQPPAQDAKLNKKNKKGETPLHSACCKFNLASVRKYLEMGAETNTQDNNSWTPLHEVSTNEKCLEIVLLLLEHGANPNVPGGEMNATPLHDAAEYGCTEICRALIKKGACKEARNALGKTPLDIAFNDATREVIESTECDMSDTEQLETTVLLNASTVPEHYVVFCHGLDSDKILSVKQAAKSLSMTLSAKMTEDVTHVIVELDQEKKSCSNDLIYLTAIVMGKSIVSFDWIEASIAAESFVDEEEFMAKGSHDCCTGAPALSKINLSNRKPRLFDGCHFFLQGIFSDPYPNKADLSTLLKAGGAVILRREPDPEAIPPEEQRLPYHAKTGSPIEKCSHFLIYQEGLKEPLLKYDMTHMKSLPAAWLVECIKNFALVDPFK